MSRSMSALCWCRLPVTALLLATLCACSGQRPEAVRPEVVVEGAVVTRVGPSSADVSIGLSIHNPNPFDLDLHSINYDLTLNSRQLISGDSQQRLTVPGNTRGRIPLEVTFEYQRVFQSLGDVIAQQRVAYQLDGSVGIGSFRVPFRSGGEFGLAQP